MRMRKLQNALDLPSSCNPSPPRDEESHRRDKEKDGVDHPLASTTAEELGECWRAPHACVLMPSGVPAVLIPGNGLLRSGTHPLNLSLTLRQFPIVLTSTACAESTQSAAGNADPLNC